jgi:hypothetical protein
MSDRHPAIILFTQPTAVGPAVDYAEIKTAYSATIREMVI